MEKFNLVVTRHSGLVDYLRELGLLADDAEVLSHASPDQVRYKRVVGVLPHSLSCLCEVFAEVPMNLPPELRGQELDLEQVRKFSGPLTTYVVRKV